MSSALDDATPASSVAVAERTAERVADADKRGVVSITELLSLAAAVTVGIVALMSLALAHLGHHTLANVSLASVVLLLVIVALVVRFDRIRVRLDPVGLVPAVVGMGLSVLFLFPGFQYGTGDRDPGTYVEIASSIARTHRLPFTDEVAAAHLPTLYLPGEVWPALWIQPGHSSSIFPQFYHLWPALLATAKDAGGFTGMFNTGPLVGLVAVVLGVAVGRRIAGAPGAWTVALILPTNMLEVWQAKYPTAEIFGQMLFLGSVLAVVLAVRAGWNAAAVAGGALLTLGYLERADGVLLVVFAWAVLCLLLAVGRFDRRAGWFTAGMLVLLPYALYQAYDLAKVYTLDNGIPRLRTIVEGALALAVVCAVLAWQRRRWHGVLAWAERRRSRLALGSTFIAICAVLVLLGGLRPKLFGLDYSTVNGVKTRTFNEISFIRLTWFFSLTGIALMCAGIAYVGWKRWRFDRWLIAVATVGLLTIYCYNLHNSPYLMWSTRRFVTTVVPGMVLLMGCGAAGIVIVLREWLPRIIGSARVRTALVPVALAGLLVGLAIFGGSESWPLRHHNENGGSIQVERQLTALSGDKVGVYLWQRVGACCAAPYMLFGGPMFGIMGQASALLPGSVGIEKATISQYLRYYGPTGRPIFYIAGGTGAPPAMSGVTVTKVIEMAGTLPHWAETYVSRPKTTNDYHFDFTVYRIAQS